MSRRTFPEDVGAAVLDYALEWCRSDGYKIIEHKRTETPNDEKFIATITVTVAFQAETSNLPTLPKAGNG